MTKATPGEQFVMGSLKATKREVREFETFAAYAKYFDDFIARERAKVAEDVLEMVANTPPNVTFDKIAEEVRAKYGKVKR